MNLTHITPENETETLILTDIQIIIRDNFSITNLIDDLKDAPEDYDYTTDDLEQFLFKYNLTKS